jgi:hypothetical protein
MDIVTFFWGILVLIRTENGSTPILFRYVNADEHPLLFQLFWYELQSASGSFSWSLSLASKFPGTSRTSCDSPNASHSWYSWCFDEKIDSLIVWFPGFPSIIFWDYDGLSGFMPHPTYFGWAPWMRKNSEVSKARQTPLLSRLRGGAWG